MLPAMVSVVAAQWQLRNKPFAGCRLRGRAAGSAGVSAEPPALPRVHGGTSPPPQHAGWPCPLIPLHPVARSHRGAGTALALLRSPNFHPIFAPARNKLLRIILSAASAAAPGRG